MNKRKSPQQNYMVIGVTVIVAVVAVAIAIVLLNSSSADAADVNYSEIAQTRTENGGFVIGDPEAPITIVAFEDFLCPHCQAYKSTVNQIMEQLVATGQARFEFRMLATQGADALNLFRVAECAGELNASGFWPVHDEIFSMTSSGRVQRSDIPREIADKFNISYTELLQCTTTADQFETDQRLANTVNATGTPAIRFRYGGIEAPLETMQQFASGAPGFTTLKGIVEAANET